MRGSPQQYAQYATALPEAEHILAAPSSEWSEPYGIDAEFAAVCVLPKHWREAWAVVRKLVSSGSFDIVHAHSSYAGAMLRTLPCPGLLVYSPHALALLAPRYSSVWLAGQAEWLLGLRAATIAAVSDDEARRVRRLSPRSRVVLLNNRPTIPAHRIARFNDPLRVVGCGRLTRQKHPEFFARVAHLSASAGHSFSFTWLGDGALHYRRLLQRSGVTVTGWLGPAEVSRQLERSTVLLHTALYEGCSFALLDAAAIGLPVIGRPVPGVAELGWVQHVSTPHEALDVLTSMSHRESWSVASQASAAAVGGRSLET